MNMGFVWDRRTQRLAATVILTWSSLHLTPASQAADTESVRINQLQYIGSHNSYHAGFAPSEAELWKRTQPQDFASLNYSHPSLTRQLDDGVHQIELDVYADPQGGKYSHPAITQWVADAGLPPDPPFADAAVMEKPGFKVMHVEDVDQRSNCQPLRACLEEVRNWSNHHPRHFPLFILLETKEDPLQLKLPTVIPQHFDAATLDSLDAEIRSVFPRERYITPDDVRGDSPTVNAAIRARGWPSLKAARGKILFLLDQRKVSPAYLNGHPSLRGRVMFTNSKPGDPDAAFVERNDGPTSEITTLVRAGYLVRARTDSELKEARTNDTRRRDAMINSGAQLLSTDFPRSEPADTGYAVQLPTTANVWCNPILNTINCRDPDLRE